MRRPWIPNRAIAFGQFFPPGEENGECSWRRHEHSQNTYVVGLLLPEPGKYNRTWIPNYPQRLIRRIYV